MSNDVHAGYLEDGAVMKDRRLSERGRSLYRCLKVAGIPSGTAWSGGGGRGMEDPSYKCYGNPTTTTANRVGILSVRSFLASKTGVRGSVFNEQGKGYKAWSSVLGYRGIGISSKEVGVSLVGSLPLISSSAGRVTATVARQAISREPLWMSRGGSDRGGLAWGKAACQYMADSGLPGLQVVRPGHLKGRVLVTWGSIGFHCNRDVGRDDGRETGGRRRPFQQELVSMIFWWQEPNRKRARVFRFMHGEKYNINVCKNCLKGAESARTRIANWRLTATARGPPGYGGRGII